MSFPVEFLLAWEGGTWTTEVHQVPDRFDGFDVPNSVVELWLQEKLEKDRDGLVLVSVYHVGPREE